MLNNEIKILKKIIKINVFCEERYNKNLFFNFFNRFVTCKQNVYSMLKKNTKEKKFENEIVSSISNLNNIIKKYINKKIIKIKKKLKELDLIQSRK
jgi:O-phosphoseryl-tRNA(Cys) synthetase